MTGLSYVSLAAGTLVSEDLACVTAGVLIARGGIDPFAAVIACAVGIFVGDLGLWALGRGGGAWAATGLRALGSRMPDARIAECRAWLEQRGAVTLLASRFLPGSRLPLYVTAGVVGVPLRVFAFWTFIAVAIWTPAIVLASAGGGSLVTPAGSGASWKTIVVAAGLVLALRAASTLRRKRLLQVRLTARLARWRRWEFWPVWLFYAPVAIRVAWLAIRYRGVNVMTAANPGIADGGTVGESKHVILEKLPKEFAIPGALIAPGEPRMRLALADTLLSERRWDYPLIVKPDVGQRGVGVKRVRSRSELREYLTRMSGAALLQPYHAGPFEAGIFYYRLPGQSRGQILSITDKQFPVIVGDGASTLEELIYRHPRFRMQADVFMRRHARMAGQVLAKGERLQLALAGNHAQGTMFRDGGHLITPALEQRIDAIARAFGGFFIGRFDIRYADVEAFRAGRDLAIVELNGATAESTNIYDPDMSLAAAYRTLFRQWSLVFRIGAENRRLGAPVTSTRRLLRMVVVHLRSTPALAPSD